MLGQIRTKDNARRRKIVDRDFQLLTFSGHWQNASSLQALKAVNLSQPKHFLDKP